MAVSTCEGSIDPLAQAAPLETYTPRSLRPIRIASASIPGKQIVVVFATRSAARPGTTASG